MGDRSEKIYGAKLQSLRRARCVSQATAASQVQAKLLEMRSTATISPGRYEAIEQATVESVNLDTFGAIAAFLEISCDALRAQIGAPADATIARRRKASSQQGIADVAATVSPAPSAPAGDAASLPIQPLHEQVKAMKLPELAAMLVLSLERFAVVARPGASVVNQLNATAEVVKSLGRDKPPQAPAPPAGKIAPTEPIADVPLPAPTRQKRKGTGA